MIFGLIVDPLPRATREKGEFAMLLSDLNSMDANLALSPPTQKFSVLCVTKRTADDLRVVFHLPISGDGTMRTVIGVYQNLVIAETLVTFQGRACEVCHVRTGLNGMCVTIGIRVPTDMEFPIWELYTDIPSIGRAKTYTIEEIQKEAVRTIERR